MGRHKPRTPEELAQMRESFKRNISSPEAIKKRYENAKLTRSRNKERWQYLNNVFDSVTNNGKTFLQDFIESNLKIALSDPNSYYSQQLFNKILPMNDIVGYLDKGAATDNADKYRNQLALLYSEFYDKQLEILYGIKHRHRMFAMTSRRCGKTHVGGGACVASALTEPNTPIVYVNLTFTNAMEQLTKVLEDKCPKCGINYTISGHYINFDNGSTIRVTGNNDRGQTNKLRGFKFKLAVVDEVGHLPDVQYLLDEVLMPATLDYPDSTILLIGTPSRVPHHWSTDTWNNDTSWTHYHWNMTQNPYIPDPMKAIEEICKGKGLSIDSPFIQREYFGNLVADTDALVFRDYKVHDNPSIIESIKNGSIKIDGISIGVDYGFNDYNAIASVAYSIKDKKAWVIYEDKFNKADISTIINRIVSSYDNACQLTNPSNIRMFADTSHQQITSELRNKHSLPIFNAYKVDKVHAIQLLAEKSRVGSFTIPSNGLIKDEFDKILWSRDDEDNITNDIDSAFHPDLMDAYLYACRFIFSKFNYQINYKEIPVTSDYIKSANGTIIGINDNSSSLIGTDSGIVG